MKRILSTALIVAAMLSTALGASAQGYRHHRRSPQTVTVRTEVRNPRLAHKKDDRRDIRFVRCERCGKMTAFPAKKMHRREIRRSDCKHAAIQHRHRHLHRR
ncbi:MAG: hypothetical protein J5937_06100 [Paludibacteraceae bacterium]|nr:hypothetical protein [Paludibacteraceae bacterium]